MTSTMALIGPQPLADDLRHLGLPPGETYLVHSSLRTVGRLEDGPETLLDALWETCGRDSTIVAPTFTAGNSTTTRAYVSRTAGMDEQQRLDEEAKIAGFDLRNSPSQNVGVFSECVRKAPGAFRSNHPQTSFSAIGPQARELVAVHDLDCHLGEKSPLRRLYDNDAVVLLIGVDFDVCTCFHLAEYRFEKRMRKRRYRTFVMNDGRRELKEFDAPDTDDRDFADIGIAMTAKSFVHEGKIGGALTHWFRMRHGVDFAVDWMNTFR
jgi:aminoglycoside 3-N-acetyltransferase